ncbi:MAG TPA: hypothetical protein VLE19_14540, partial [Pyrinomonadaceae bacterium]|nr:hypothetical protein [Pyrinomonadaceae bacterium]
RRGSPGGELYPGATSHADRSDCGLEIRVTRGHVGGAGKRRCWRGLLCMTDSASIQELRVRWQYLSCLQRPFTQRRRAAILFLSDRTSSSSALPRVL